MAQIKVILFDVNETIIHQGRTERSHIASTYAALAPFRWSITFEEFETAWNTVHGAFARQYHEGYELVLAGQLDRAREKLREPWYRENIAAILKELEFPACNRLIEELTWAFQDSWVGGLTMPDENRHTLRQLASLYRLGIVTNFQQPNIVSDILDQFGIGDLFDPIVISATEGIRKPHPDLFRVALDRLGMSSTPECVSYVGDSLGDDVDGALRVGLCPILIDTKDRHSSVVTPAIRIRRLAELPDALFSHC